MKKVYKYFFKAFLIPLLFISNPVLSQEEDPSTRVLFIFDSSQSMYANWEGGTRMEVAKKLLSNMLDSLRNQQKIELGLRVYGHQRPVPPPDCKDTRLEVGFGLYNIDQIQKHIIRF